MISSFIFSDGRLVGRDLELEALRLVVADKGLMVWVDLSQPDGDEVKAILDSTFHFHPLTIEDCEAPSSLPKIEDYDEYLFLVTHGVDFSRSEKFSTTELSLFLGKDFLVTFHHKPLKSVADVVDRCQKGVQIARGSDRLAHMILDGLVDHYQPVTEAFRAELDEIEDAVLSPDDTNLTSKLIEVRNDISNLRQVIRPQRDVVGKLARGDNKMIRSLMLPYFRDLRDNLTRIDETAANFSDQLLISFDLYLSKSSFQANDGIKALTALTAISLPATVVGSWYGMNFVHMPELQGPYSYYVVASLTLLWTLFTWRWCKRRGWI
ncbi:MAG: magnesium/cobalt transporter CorA [Opitutaceae bacterium]|jgi:magnesium transporter